MKWAYVKLPEKIKTLDKTFEKIASCLVISNFI